jgi:hypothetical protein
VRKYGKSPMTSDQGHGHLEKVYENALAHRLRKAGLDVSQQALVPLYRSLCVLCALIAPLRLSVWRFALKGRAWFFL